MNIDDIDFRSDGSKSVLLVLSGPGGSGKSTLIKKWLDQDKTIGFVKNVTTRAKRKPDAGVDDHDFFEFVSVESFKQYVVNGELVQWSNPSEGYYSGTLLKPIKEAISFNKDLLLDYTPQLFLNFKRMFRSRVVSVFIVPPSMAVLKKRLQNRGTEDGKKFEMKYKMGVQDISYVNEHDYYVINDDLDETLTILQAIRTAEKAKLANQIGIEERFLAVTNQSMLFYYDPTDARLAAMDEATCHGKKDFS